MLLEGKFRFCFSRILGIFSGNKSSILYIKHFSVHSIEYMTAVNALLLSQMLALTIWFSMLHYFHRFLRMLTLNQSFCTFIDASEVSSQIPGYITVAKCIICQMLAFSVNWVIIHVWLYQATSRRLRQLFHFSAPCSVAFVLRAISCTVHELHFILIAASVTYDMLVFPSKHLIYITNRW